MHPDTPDLSNTSTGTTTRYPRDDTPVEEGGIAQDVLIYAQEIAGRYEEIREQGSGGIGRVILVKDRHLGRHVALKELAVSSSQDDATLTVGAETEGATPRVIRFLREAQITALLEHPSIVPVYEMGRRANGTLYYTMKLIRGRTLEKAIQETGGLSGRLGLLPHFVDLCQAIAYAHSRGIIHRDVKPSNVLVGEFGETVVIDWGIAGTLAQHKAPAACPENAAPEGSDDRLTRCGQSLGTPRYMSPEQIRGEVTNIAEPSDVYALGTILYEILTGRHPFASSDAATLFHDVLTREPDPVRTLEPKAPAELEAICRRAMSRNPEQRYANAGELVEELKRFQAGALVSAYQYHSIDRLRRFVCRHAAVLATALIALVAVLATGALAVVNIVKQEAAAELALYEASINLAHNAIENGRLEEAEEALARAPAQHRGLEWGLVQGMCHPERIVLRGHTDTVEYAGWSPDGTRIVTCGHDQLAYIWDARSGQRLHELHLPDQSYHRALWSMDGRFLILATQSERICIYSAHDYTLLREVAGYAPAMTADGTILAAATEFGEVITFYDPDSGAVLRKFPKLSTHMIHIALSDKGQQVAAAVDDGSVWAWSWDSDAAWQTAPVHAPSARFVVFSPDGSMLFSVGADGTGALWDAKTGVELRRMVGHEAGISSACFLPEGQEILTASNDRTIRIWAAATGQEVGRHDGFSTPLGFIALSPNGTEFITHADSSVDRMAAVIYPVVPLPQRQTLQAHTGPVNAVAFSPEGTVLASAAGSWRYANDDRIILWNTADYSLRREIKTGNGSVHCVTFFADGTRLVAGNQNGTASIYDTGTGTCLRSIAAHPSVCRCVAVSPDQQLLATASWDGHAAFWDVSSGQRRALFKADPSRLDVVSFDPTGQFAVTGGMGREVKIWSVPEATLIASLNPGFNLRVSAIAFSPDGTWLLIGGDRGHVMLWDIKQRRIIRTFEGHKSIVYAVAFSSDGRRIITAGKDAAIWFWDIHTGRQVMFLDRHKETINALALRSDDGQLASASDDGTIVLWPILPWPVAQ